MEETISFLKNNDIYFTESEDLKLRSSFRIGQKADLAIFPDSDEKLIKTVLFFKKRSVKYLILGRCSNVLFPDYNINYPLIFTDRLISLQFDDDNPNYLICDSGVSLAKLVNFATQYGFGGMEFAGGIPGSVGGAVYMNAGAYGGEMKDVLKEVTVLTDEGEFLTIPKEELELGYRTSVIAKKGYIVIEAVLELKSGNADEIRAYMDELKEKRITKQPLEYPSAGSTFKRPEGYFAGKLIQDADLRGFQVGGAQVSEKHCGFVINKDHATAADIVELMQQVSDRVEEKFGVKLEPEVKRLGEF